MIFGVEEAEPEPVEKHELPKYLKYLHNVVPPPGSRSVLSNEVTEQPVSTTGSLLIPIAEEEAVVSAATPPRSPLKTANKLASAAAAIRVARGGVMRPAELVTTSPSSPEQADFVLPNTPTRSQRDRGSPPSARSRVVSGRGTPNTASDALEDTLSPTQVLLMKKGKFKYASAVASPITISDFARAMGPIQVRNGGSDISCVEYFHSSESEKVWRCRSRRFESIISASRATAPPFL